MRAAPEDCATRMDFVRFALGRPDLFGRGLAVMDDAVLALECVPTLDFPGACCPSEFLRERLFDLTLEATESAAARSDAEALFALLSRARLLARNDPQQVRLRFVFADAWGRVDRLAEMVGLFQEILEDEGLRSAPCYDQGGTIRAGRLSERRIRTLIQKHGREIYAQYDAAADQMFTDASARDDLTLIRSLIDRYPHARAVSRASIHLAQTEKKLGRPAVAARLLQQALDRYSTIDSREPSLLLMIADCCFDSGNATAGLAWLSRGARDHPEAMLPMDGHTETFSSLYSERLAEAGDALRPSPAVNLPLQQTHRIDWDKPVFIVKPRRDPLPSAKPQDELALIGSERMIEAFVPSSGEQRWQLSYGSTVVPTLFTSRNDLLILASLYRAWAVERETGRVRLTVGRDPPRSGAALADPERYTRLMDIAVSETQLVAVFEDGQAVAMDLDDGDVSWERQLAHQFKGPAVLTDEHFIYASTRDEKRALVMIDRTTGRDLRLATMEHERLVYWMGSGPNRHVITVGSDWVASYDPDTGIRAWYNGPLQPLQWDTTRIGSGYLYLSTTDGVLTVLSTADGRMVWRSSTSEVTAEATLAIWLDRGNVYQVRYHSVSAFEVDSGNRLWTTRVPVGATIDSSILSERHVLLVASTPGESSAQIEVKAAFIDRRTGCFLGPEGESAWSLGSFDRVPEVAVYEGTILLRDERGIIAWTGP